MFALSRIAHQSSCGKFVAIEVTDVPKDCQRTGRCPSPSIVCKEAGSSADLMYTGPSLDVKGTFVGVRVEDLKKLQPTWFITKDELLNQFELMQQEKGTVIKDPELLKRAKELWSEKLASLRKKT